MTLFAALTSPTNNSSSTPSSSSSCSPPEAIQLYSHRLVDFLSGITCSLNLKGDASSSSSLDGGGGVTDAGHSKDNNKNAPSSSTSRHFSMLSYQAVQVRQDDAPPSSSGGVAMKHARPDLGIWDCRILLASEGGETATTTSETTDAQAEASAMMIRRVVVNRHHSTNTNTNNDVNAKEEEKKDDGNNNNDGGKNNNDVASDSVRTVVMSVDLSDPNQVQPVVEQMRKVIVNLYNEDSTGSSNSGNAGGAACTTPIKALATTSFGSAKITDVASLPSSTSNSNYSKNEPRVALILAAIIPSSLQNPTKNTNSPAEAFQERQARALVLYHLNKFALEVDCTLCFVSDCKVGAGENAMNNEEGVGDAAGTSNAGEHDSFLLGRNSTLSIEELSKVIRRVSLGLSPVEDEGKNGLTNAATSMGGDKSDAGDGQAEDANATTTKSSDGEAIETSAPSIHVPGTHDVELIHGAYLRNASCEGRWDAGRDDLSVALPPRSASSGASEKSSVVKQTAATTISSLGAAAAGDEEWLSKLASSIGLNPDSTASSASATTPSTTSGAEGGDTASTKALTPAEKKKREMALAKKKSARTAGKKDQKEVSSFFENLLKK